VSLPPLAPLGRGTPRFPRKIISGGQTGADQAGLRAAVILGLGTGGWAPFGWRTLDGPAPWLEESGLREANGGYAFRTELNVRDADGTVRFAADFNSPGERCTLNALKKHGKPYIDFNPLSPSAHPPTFKKWLIDNQIRVLNVAGNAEQTAPGMFNAVVAFLVHALGTPARTTVMNQKHELILPDYVYIGRGSKWGNPYSHVASTRAEVVRVPTREIAIEKYREYLRGQPALIAAARTELRGKVLACFCKPLPCHGDILARVADGEEP
jgi:hypothetical protein